jgi:hypothetical protein
MHACFLPYMLRVMHALLLFPLSAPLHDHHALCIAEQSRKQLLPSAEPSSSKQRIAQAINPRPYHAQQPHSNGVKTLPGSGALPPVGGPPPGSLLVSLPMLS